LGIYALHKVKYFVLIVEINKFMKEAGALSEFALLATYGDQKP